MRKKIVRLSVAALASVFVALQLSIIANAQKQDPTPYQPPDPNALDFKTFADAYDKAGDPKILVLCGLDTRVGQPQKPQEVTANGLVQPDLYTGNNLSLFDSAGDAAAIKSSIEENLTQTDVRLVSLSALVDADRRTVKLMEQRQAEDAIDLVATKTNADIVIVVRLISSSDVRQRGASYRATVDMLNVTNGRKIGGFVFDWKGGLDAASIKQYSRAITRKLFDQFDSYYLRPSGAARKYTVRLVGVSDVAFIRQVRNAFARIPGVAKVLTDDTATANGQSVANLEVSYQGDPLDLASDIQATARRELGMAVDAVDSNGGSITLMSKPRRAGTGNALLDPSDPDHEAQLAALMHAYNNRSNPSIGIMVNRELTDEEKKDPKVAQQIEQLKNQLAAAGRPDGAAPNGGTPSVVIQLATGGGSISGRKADQTGGPDGANAAGGPDKAAQPGTAAAEDVLSTRRVEDYLFKDMVKFGLHLVDPNVAREEVRKKIGQEQTIFGENELAYLLGQAANVDYLIEGAGRLETKGANGSNSKMGYTFRVVRVSDGTVIAADGQDVDVSQDAMARNRVLEALSDFIAQSLALQMERAWSPPTKMTVTVYNARTPRDVLTMLNFMKDDVNGVTEANLLDDMSGKEGGIGRFTIEYTCSFEDLLKQITDLGAKLPFDLDSHGVSRDNLSIKIREGT